MDRLVIRGGRRLEGSVEVRGAKNAVLPQIAATLLSSEPLELGNVPEVTDVASMVALLRVFGVEADHGRRLILNASAARNAEAPYDMVRKMRASILVLAPLLVRFGTARVSLPGGCAIGARPVDLHLKALAALGAQVEMEGGYITARIDGDRLQGGHVIFSTPSVGATETALMGAVLARGESEILNAARDPEICDLALCLGAMGARIEGAGTHRIQVQGVDALHKARHELLTDRIEAGTYAIAAAITGGHLEILGARLEHLGAVGAALEHAGVQIWPTDRGLMISRSGPLHAVDIVTEPYPGFPTDLQAQFTALMTIAQGASVIRETVFESRFMHVPELARLGANISLQGSTALVRGVEGLHGAQVMATDLRASVCLVLAGLVADGETIINRIYHLDRGYETLDRKLVQCGADIRRVAE